MHQKCAWASMFFGLAAKEMNNESKKRFSGGSHALARVVVRVWVRSRASICACHADESARRLQLRYQPHGPLRRRERHNVPWRFRLRYHGEFEGFGIGAAGVSR